jgi:hypothetical protein
MPSGNPADESPGVVTPLSQLGHGRATDLKSTNTIDHDRPLSRQLFDPAGQRGGSVPGGTRQHIGASRQIPGQAEIQKEGSAIFVVLKRGRVYDDKDVQERIVRGSKLDWVIVRPVILTNGPNTNAYRALVDPRGWTCGFISRADVADFLVKQIDDDAFLHETP